MRLNFRTRLDKICFSLYVGGGPLLVAYEILVLSHYYRDGWPPGAFIHIVFGTYCLINIYYNLYSIASSNTTGSTTSTGANAIVCQDCYLPSPPRSHHCRICNVCVLRRDHHCWFAGKCVGHANYRYFFAMVLYNWILAMYCNWYNFRFALHYLGASPWSVISLLFPHFPVFVREYTSMCIFVNFITSIGAMLLAMFTAILVMQLVQVVYGQTRYERNKKIFAYSSKLSHNITEFLGVQWYSVLCTPLLKSSSVGDGLHYDSGGGRMKTI